MGQHFVDLTGINHFAIDQAGVVPFQERNLSPLPFTPAGFLADDPPAGIRPTRGVDACIVGIEPVLE